MNFEPYQKNKIATLFEGIHELSQITSCNEAIPIQVKLSWKCVQSSCHV